ncbi:NAD(P)-binding domain-containing protein [Actinomadura alba]|uniref:NAD(P)-binding domain-containing protein n=1 Tax=Actinomadura alba TaxID=406431 RepID=A0ABR7LR00_9ACTN|nr:TIGR03862 family flavoprotein [Actinomadura alba]MBC6467269.1 NAD(P)-binding domain-containing protein [Actinomadura alba]
MTRFMPDEALLASPRGRAFPFYADQDTAMRRDAVPPTVDLVIVGGGLAGLAVYSACWHAGLRNVVLLERTGVIGGQFFQRVDRLKQRVLRSPYDHHPGAEGHRDCELLDFARLHWAHLTDIERREVRMAQAGHRSVVPLDVFEGFCRHVAAIHQVYARSWQAHVSQLESSEDSVCVKTSNGEIRARSVVMCTGERRVQAPDSWRENGKDWKRVFYWDEPVPEHASAAVVVGAGLSAAHVIANFLDKGSQVDWILRKTERYQCADVNASFFRAEGRARFLDTDRHQRLELMRRERRASIMFEFEPRIRRAEFAGQLRVHRNSHVACIGDTGEGVRLAIEGGRSIEADIAVLALGTQANVGAGLLPDEIIAPRDGWPDIEQATLAYTHAPRIHVVGAAAAMALGPAARNIDGHRVATARVLKAITRTCLPAKDGRDRPSSRSVGTNA